MCNLLMKIRYAAKDPLRPTAVSSRQILGAEEGWGNLQKQLQQEEQKIYGLYTCRSVSKIVNCLLVYTYNNNTICVIILMYTSIYIFVLIAYTIFMGIDMAMI